VTHSEGRRYQPRGPDSDDFVGKGFASFPRRANAVRRSRERPIAPALDRLPANVREQRQRPAPQRQIVVRRAQTEPTTAV